ncbi:hypothetical protein DERP_010669 [Dermatophagoides pteronyssinus]|uniref:Uncharacterized protein n=1 Tax=Dermatophagoides pteronyssinus TaxID=6956 RepID=A0ABQ8JAQ0_DERPT|nr:hypothetical protein DERP_010669 [Dermatophagoides pteronyssinus]
MMMVVGRRRHHNRCGGGGGGGAKCRTTNILCVYLIKCVIKQVGKNKDCMFRLQTAATTKKLLEINV